MVAANVQSALVTKHRTPRLGPTDFLRGDNARVVVRTVEMVWVALGRLPAKGAHVTICNHDHLAIGNVHRSRPGSLGLDHEEARAAMRLLRAERERQEREKLKMVEQHDHPAE